MAPLPRSPAPWCPADVFVLRTPRLSIDEFIDWSTGTEALGAAGALGDPVALAAALQRDAELLRQRLRTLVTRPEVREALYFGSPDLEAAIETWLRAPTSRQGQKVERTLVRYVARMAGRPTPIGLLAGITVGTMGGVSRLALAPATAIRRHTRLGTMTLDALAEALARDPALREQLVFVPHASLHRVGEGWRYLETVEEGHRLAALGDDPHLERALECATSGARPDELAAALAGDEVSLAEAREFVDELIEAQVLVADLTPPLTGVEPAAWLEDRLSALGLTDLADELASLRRALAELDPIGQPTPPTHYRALHDRLSRLPGAAGLYRPFVVDMVRPAEACVLGDNVAAEILRGVRLLGRMHPPGPDPLWAAFSDAFVRRYGHREVPLGEALSHIEFGRLPRDSFETPLLASLPYRAYRAYRSHRTDRERAQVSHRWNDLLGLFLGKFEAAWRGGADEIHLDEAELPVDDEAIRPLPAAFSALATVYAASEEAITAGDFSIYLAIAAGPSGVRQIARHLQGAEDDGLHQAVTRHLRGEEALSPHAVFAEIVSQTSRSADPLVRPRLREYEIPYLGRSGAPPDRQLPLDDLLISVRGERVVLRSRRLGREVLPRLSTADNYKREPDPFYAFLCELQAQHTLQWLFLHLGPLLDVRFRPRIRSGRVIFSHALWTLGPDDLAALDRPTPAARFLALARLRERLRLPRWVALSEIGDTEMLLPVDLDNVLCVESLLHRVRRRREVALRELPLGPGDLPVRGPEGRYLHELVLPFLRSASPSAHVTTAPSPVAPAPIATPPAREDVITLRLFCTPEESDLLLGELVTPLAERAREEGAVAGWHYTRERSQAWHLSLRLHGPRLWLDRTVTDLRAAAQPPLRDGRLQKWAVETTAADRASGDDHLNQDPTGPAALARLLRADSESALHLATSDLDLDERWGVTLLGAHRLLAALGLTPEERRSLAENLARHQGHRRDAATLSPHLGRLLPRLLTEKWPDLVHPGLLDPGAETPHAVAAAAEAGLSPVLSAAAALAELPALSTAGARVSPGGLAAQLARGHVNRRLRSARPADELALWVTLAELLRPGDPPR